MKKQIRCAVLGLGRLGYWHAENLATKIKGATLQCVADPFAGQAEKVARELDAKQWTRDPNEVFENSNIDAVIIATPTSTHADMIQKAAKNGKHIFVEKPLTNDVKEADEVIRIIQENQVLCQVGFMRRFDPAYVEAKRRVLAGDIGTPIYFKGVSRDPGSPPAEFIKNSGGIFFDMSIHDYDVARFLLGAEVTTVSAHGNVLVNSFMEEFHDVDQSLTYITFDSGAAADVEASRNAFYGYDIRGEIMGTEGTIVIGSLRYHDVQVLNKNGSTHDIVPAFPERFNNAYQLEMAHFIDCLRKNEAPAVTAIDGKIALEIAAAAKKSFETGQKVHLHSIGSMV
ncbi:inositol 2-dehydrogenase [Aneurinibacillus terranovensis]|uniref:inositol 2-dehydrogenase n=1 Tax=Aneurinibacillus terranovensis TaxID=278991 RepID=UPI000426BB08|nr:inositol 2-dehydrogenase [Aneurinibacillus terranovensis]